MGIDSVCATCPDKQPLARLRLAPLRRLRLGIDAQMEGLDVGPSFLDQVGAKGVRLNLDWTLARRAAVPGGDFGIGEAVAAAAQGVGVRPDRGPDERGTEDQKGHGGAQHAAADRNQPS